MGALVHQKQKFSINFTKANTKVCLSLDYTADNSYLFVNGKEILSPIVHGYMFIIVYVGQIHGGG